jgi:hypothetical protein
MACTPTEVATLLSHVHAIRKAFHDGHEFALVAEDDVDFSLYDDHALRKIVASLPQEWGSLQLYTGHFRVVEWMIKTFPPYTAWPRNSKELRSSNAWSNACVLYSRRGMEKILEVFGKEGLYNLDFSMVPPDITHEADNIIPGILGADAYLSTRPLVNVRMSASTIDNNDIKPMMTDLMIGKYGKMLLGSAKKIWYGSKFEIARTTSHLKVLAHAFHAGLDRVVVADHDLQVGMVDFPEVAKAIAAAQFDSIGSNSSGIVIQLAKSYNIFENVTRYKFEVSPAIVPQPVDAIGTSLYAVVGRQVLQEFANLWDEASKTVTVPKESTFVADVFLYQATQTRRAAVFAPFAVKVPMPSTLDWSGISHMPGRRFLGSCIKCPTGWGPREDKLRTCSQCETGMYSEHSLVSYTQAICVNCKAGNFQDEKGQDECKSCPPGKRTVMRATDVDGVLKKDLQGQVKEGATSSMDCVFVCKPGEYLANILTNFEECKTCPKGFFSEKFLATKCKRCDRGTYSDVDGADTEESCINCPAGKFSGEGNEQAALTGLDACKSCDAGQYSPRRSIIKADCVDSDSCRKGTYALPGTQKCVACPAGRWSDKVGVKFFEESEPCVACAAGKKPGVNVNLNPSTRKHFWESNVTDEPMKNPCYESCKKVRYSTSGHSHSSCQYDSSSCSVGTFANVVEEPIDCKLKNSKDCEDKCFKKCKQIGIFTSEWFLGACLCHSHQCLACPSGYFNNKVGQQQCKKCQQGRFTAQPNQFSCKLCEAGKSLNETTWDLTQGQTCVNCSPGLYSRDGEAVCKETCDQGTQKDETTSSSCEVCPHGNGPWNENGNIPWTCGWCPTGQFKDEERCYLEYFQRSPVLKAMFCNTSECQVNAPTNTLPHEVAMDGCGAKECAHMDLETWARFHFYNMKDDVPQGDSFYNPRHCGCTICRAGKYNNRKGARHCTDCPRGRASSELESKDISVCRKCTSGFHAKISGMSECVPCAVGRYSNEPDSENKDCHVCIAGQYQDEKGKAACKSCDQNTIIGVEHNNLVDAHGQFFCLLELSQKFICLFFLFFFVLKLTSLQMR